MMEHLRKTGIETVAHPRFDTITKSEERKAKSFTSYSDEIKREGNSSRS